MTIPENRGNFSCLVFPNLTDWELEAKNRRVNTSNMMKNDPKTIFFEIWILGDLFDDFGIRDAPNTVNPYQSKTMKNHDFESQNHRKNPPESEFRKNRFRIVFHYVRTVCSPIYSS